METRAELVVFDDQAGTRATLQTLLASHGPLQVARSWEEAKEMVHSQIHRVGLIGLPSGPDLLRHRLAALRSAPNPLVLLAHRSSFVTLSPGPKDPPRLVLNRLFTPAQLRSKIEEAIARAEPLWEGTSKKNGQGASHALSTADGIEPLVVGIAHRLNTFLVAVKTFSQIAQERSGDQAEFHRAFQAEIEQIECLVRDLSGLIEHSPVCSEEILLAPFLKETLQEEREFKAIPVQWVGPERSAPARIKSDSGLLRHGLKLLLTYLAKSGTKGVEVRAGLGPPGESPSLMVLEFTSLLPYALSETEARVTEMYLFLARAALARLGIGLQDGKIDDEKRRIRMSVPTGITPPTSLPAGARPEERRNILYERPL
jgi:signal transduction histidine kinase